MHHEIMRIVEYSKKVINLQGTKTVDLLVNAFRKFIRSVRLSDHFEDIFNNIMQEILIGAKTENKNFDTALTLE